MTGSRLLNITRLYRTMHWIEAFPETFEPSIWGVTRTDGSYLADFAGWSVIHEHPLHKPPRGIPDGQGGWVVDHWWVDGEWMPAYAQKLLGLTLGQRILIMDAGVTVRSLRVVVDELARSHGETDDATLLRMARRAGASIDTI
jgi:hypothetical protein